MGQVEGNKPSSSSVCCAVATSAVSPVSSVEADAVSTGLRLSDGSDYSIPGWENIWVDLGGEG